MELRHYELSTKWKILTLKCINRKLSAVTGVYFYQIFIWLFHMICFRLKSYRVTILVEIRNSKTIVLNVDWKSYCIRFSMTSYENWRHNFFCTKVFLHWLKIDWKIISFDHLNDRRQSILLSNSITIVNICIF